MDRPDQNLLFKRIKDSLIDVYGNRLAGIVVYGSVSRNEANEDSDIDI